MSEHPTPKSLARLFRGYFHQDWDLDGSTPALIVDQFVRNNPPSLVQAVLDDVERVRMLGLSEPQTERILVEAGLDHYPPSDGMTHIDFLTLVAERLRG